VYPLQQAFCCELSQITANGVFGQTKFLAEIFRYHLPVPAQEVEDFLFALTGEHRNTIARTEGLHDNARRCTKYPD
jgi:hypothetical protein